jgi:hypothetical protein
VDSWHGLTGGMSANSSFPKEAARLPKEKIFNQKAKLHILKIEALKLRYIRFVTLTLKILKKKNISIR